MKVIDKVGQNTHNALCFMVYNGVVLGGKN